MRLRTRGRWGVQAGILAGMAVAAVFFVADLARTTPLSTPLFFSQTILHGAGFALGGDGMVQTLAGFSPGGRLALFTALHLSLFAVLGVLAGGMANLFHVRWSWRTGGIAGLAVGLLVWLMVSRIGTAWLAAAGLTLPVFVGAAIVGGAVLGWHLRLCHIDEEEIPSRARAASL